MTKTLLNDDVIFLLSCIEMVAFDISTFLLKNGRCRISESFVAVALRWKMGKIDW